VDGDPLQPGVGIGGDPDQLEPAGADVGLQLAQGRGRDGTGQLIDMLRTTMNNARRRDLVPVGVGDLSGGGR
jgi:hypothetical protein